MAPNQSPAAMQDNNARLWIDKDRKRPVGIVPFQKNGPRPQRQSGFADEKTLFQGRMITLGQGHV